MLITELSEHPRNPGRYRITLDADTSFVVDVATIADLKLKSGRDLTEPELARLEQAAALTACFDKALATLGARARSAADLKRYLKTKDFTDVQVAPVIEKLQALGLLDDRKFALGFARSRLAPSRGFGPRRVAAELQRKGVARTIVDSVLQELAAEREEAADAARERGETVRSALEEAAQKKLRSMQGLEPEVRKRRLYAYLARRGFDAGDIVRALESIEERRVRNEE